MSITLDEVFERIRTGTDPKALAHELGVSERTLRYRATSAGRLPEYKAVVDAYHAGKRSEVDVDRLMALADEGRSLNSACVEVGCARSTATARLENDGRLAEFYMRSQETRRGKTIPQVSSEEYHQGPRTVLIGMMAQIPEDSRDEYRSAILRIDGMMSDADKLSRLCGGGAR